MAKKNEPTPTEAPQPVRASTSEPLQWFAVARSVTIGGHLKHPWLVLGYDLHWREGEKRLAPASLVARSEVSLTVVGPQHKDRKASPQARPPTGQTGTSPDALKEKYSREPRVKVLCTYGWKNGVFASQFIALEMPCHWYEGEIREIPPSLWESLQWSGATNFTVDPRQVEEAEKDGRQARWAFKRRQWFEEHSARVARQVAQYEAAQQKQANELRKAQRRAELGI